MAAQRKHLTLKRKIELIEKVERGGKSRKEFAEDFGVSPPTVTGIMKEKEHLKALFYSGERGTQAKSGRSAVESEVETGLLAWFKMCRGNNIPLTGPIMHQKAEELARNLAKPDWKCSQSWVQRFNNRHSISFRKVTGEGGDVDEQAADQWTEDVLLPTLQEYQERDVYNMDECAMFWRVLPDRSMAFRKEKCKGGKRSKDRVTVVTCSNLDGSDKRPLVVIGKFQTPRCFKGVKKLPVQYEASKKAWMTSDLFEKWVRAFDRHMDSQHRKVLLVMDNCPAHVRPLQDLKATRMLFLPPNSTAKLQPMDAGVIANLKSHYRTSMLMRVVQHIDSGSTLPEFQFTLLNAMTTLKSAWEHVTASTIRNCFRKAGFVVPARSEEARAPDEESESGHRAMEPILSRLYKELKISMDDFCNFDDDLATCAAPTTEDVLSSTAVSTSGAASDSDSDVDDCGEQQARVLRSEAWSAVSTVELFLMQTGGNETLTSRFYSFKQLFEHSVRQCPNQTQITGFFSVDGKTTTGQRSSEEEGAKKTGKEEGGGAKKKKTGMEEEGETKKKKTGVEEEEGAKKNKTGMKEDLGREEDDIRTEMENDVQFIRRVPNVPQSFTPTTAAWRQEQSKRLELPSPNPLPERQAKAELGVPTQVNNIKGDGNCLFRALSLEVCGTQEYHEELRALIVDIMCRHEETFSAYVGHDLGEYICNHALPTRSWGSDVEIFAAATLLQTTVVVYTTISPTSRKWLSHPPLFPLPGVEQSKEKIYLRNLCSHFERVVGVA